MVPQGDNDLLTRAEASAFRPPCRHVRSRPYYPRGLLRDWAKAQIIEVRTGRQRLPPQVNNADGHPDRREATRGGQTDSGGAPRSECDRARARAAWDIHSRLQERFFS